MYCENWRKAIKLSVEIASFLFLIFAMPGHVPDYLLFAMFSRFSSVPTGTTALYKTPDDAYAGACRWGGGAC